MPFGVSFPASQRQTVGIVACTFVVQCFVIQIVIQRNKLFHSSPIRVKG